MAQDLYMSIGKGTAQKKKVALANYNKKRMVVGYYNGKKIFDIRDKVVKTFSVAPKTSNDLDWAYFHAGVRILIERGVSSTCYIQLTINGKNYLMAKSFDSRPALSAVVNTKTVRNYILTLPENIVLEDGAELTARVVYPQIVPSKESASFFKTYFIASGTADFTYGSYNWQKAAFFFPPVPGAISAIGAPVQLVGMPSGKVYTELTASTKTSKGVSRAASGDNSMYFKGGYQYVAGKGYYYEVEYMPNACDRTMKVYVSKES